MSAAEMVRLGLRVLVAMPLAFGVGALFGVVGALAGFGKDVER